MGLDPRFADMLAHWFDACEQLLQDDTLEENTRDLVESYMVFFSFHSLLHGLLNETATVIEVTRNERGQVVDIKVGEHGEAQTEGS